MKKFVYILVGISFIGCSEDVQNKPVPEDLISGGDIIPIIIDLQILESHYQRLYSRPDVYKDALDSASNIVFEDRSVTRDQFESSYDFYAARSDDLFNIYEATLDTINQRISERQQLPVVQEQ